MKNFVFILIILFSSNYAMSNETFYFDEKLCFYEEDNVKNPVRFVYYNKFSKIYIFSFVEEDNSSKILKKSKNPYFKKNGIKYSTGKKVSQQKQQISLKFV